MLRKGSQAVAYNAFLIIYNEKYLKGDLVLNENNSIFM